MYYTRRVPVVNKFKIVERYRYKRIFQNVVFYYYYNYFCNCERHSQGKKSNKNREQSVKG